MTDLTDDLWTGLMVGRGEDAIAPSVLRYLQKKEATLQIFKEFKSIDSRNQTEFEVQFGINGEEIIPSKIFRNRPMFSATSWPIAVRALFDMHKNCKLTLETLFAAHSMLARCVYIDARLLSLRNEHALVLCALTCLWSAAKVEETLWEPNKGRPHIEEIANAGPWNRADVFRMECEVMMALKFDISVPNALHYLEAMNHMFSIREKGVLNVLSNYGSKKQNSSVINSSSPNSSFLHNTPVSIPVKLSASNGHFAQNSSNSTMSTSIPLSGPLSTSSLVSRSVVSGIQDLTKSLASFTLHGSSSSITTTVGGDKLNNSSSLANSAHPETSSSFPLEKPLKIGNNNNSNKNKPNDEATSIAGLAAVGNGNAPLPPHKKKRGFFSFLQSVFSSSSSSSTAQSSAQSSSLYSNNAINKNNNNSDSSAVVNSNEQQHAINSQHKNPYSNLIPSSHSTLRLVSSKKKILNSSGDFNHSLPSSDPHSSFPSTGGPVIIFQNSSAGFHLNVFSLAVVIAQISMFNPDLAVIPPSKLAAALFCLSSRLLIEQQQEQHSQKQLQILQKQHIMLLQTQEKDVQKNPSTKNDNSAINQVRRETVSPSNFTENHNKNQSIRCDSPLHALDLHSTTVSFDLQNYDPTCHRAVQHSSNYHFNNTNNKNNIIPNAYDQTTVSGRSSHGSVRTSTHKIPQRHANSMLNAHSIQTHVLVQQQQNNNNNNNNNNNVLCCAEDDNIAHSLPSSTSSSSDSLNISSLENLIPYCSYGICSQFLFVENSCSSLSSSICECLPSLVLDMFCGNGVFLNTGKHIKNTSAVNILSPIVNSLLTDVRHLLWRGDSHRASFMLNAIHKWLTPTSCPKLVSPFLLPNYIQNHGGSGNHKNNFVINYMNANSNSSASSVNHDDDDDDDERNNQRTNIATLKSSQQNGSYGNNTLQSVMITQPSSSNDTINATVKQTIVVHTKEMINMQPSSSVSSNGQKHLTLQEQYQIESISSKSNSSSSFNFHAFSSSSELPATKSNTHSSIAVNSNSQSILPPVAIEGSVTVPVSTPDANSLGTILKGGNLINMVINNINHNNGNNGNNNINSMVVINNNVNVINNNSMKVKKETSGCAPIQHEIAI